MTLEDALAYVEDNGPIGELAEKQKQIDEVAAAFDKADVAHDPALLTRIRRLVHKASAHAIHMALELCWMRAECKLGNHAAVAEAIRTANYSGGSMAIASIVGVEVWPVVRMLVAGPLPARFDHDKLVDLVARFIRPEVPDSDARFAEVCSLSTSIAARALASARWWGNFGKAYKRPEIPIARMLAPLVPQIAGPDGDHIVSALCTAAECGESLAALAPLIDDATLSGPHAAHIAFALTCSAITDGVSLRYLDDPRPAVRLGVVRALAKDPRLVSFVRDLDRTVRIAAITRLGERGIDPAEVVPLVSALDAGGPDLADLLVVRVDERALLAACATVGSPVALALAARLQRQHALPTRACPTCKELPRDTSWNDDSRAPAKRAELTQAREKLLRCKLCSACYASDYWYDDSDSMARHETWTLKRLTLGEIQRDYGSDLVPDWTEALIADLDHPDPHWRTEAAHERAKDLVAARQLDRIESELLRHSRTEVPREALHILRSRAGDAPISGPTLALLAASPDEPTRTIALHLSAVQRGTLDEQPLDTRDDCTTAELLVKRGATISPPFVARLLDRALTATSDRWALDSLVEEAALSAAHVSATQARLRAALVVPSTRHRALELVDLLAKRSLMDDETRLLALQQYESDLEGALAVALSDNEHPLPPAIASAALRTNASNSTNTIVQRLTKALADGEDIRWAITALGANARLFRESYDATRLLEALAKRGVDISDAVSDLLATIETAMGLSAQQAVTALVHHHMRRGETDPVLALLSHFLSAVRGAAVSALTPGDLPPAIITRLQQIATEPAWYPRGGVDRLLKR